MDRCTDGAELTEYPTYHRPIKEKSPVGLFFISTTVEKRLCRGLTVRALYYNGGAVMTITEKKQLIELKDAGLGYKRIAACTGLPIGTVKTFFRRQVARDASIGPVCQQCGGPIEAGRVKRERKFCSDQCRMRWWSAHPEQMNRRSGRKLICPWCKKVFIVYGEKKRVYCSRECYSAARKAMGELEG